MRTAIMTYTTYTGKTIETQEVDFVTARGAKISLIVLRNVRIGIAGDYLAASTHLIDLTINGKISTYSGVELHADHGYVIKAPGLTIPVPAAHIDAVRALVDGVTEHNDAVRTAASAADAAYRAQTAAINAAMGE